MTDGEDQRPEMEPMYPIASVHPALRPLPRALLILLSCLLCAGSFTGCATTQSNIPAERRRPQPLDVLGAGDTLKITYMGALEQSQVVKVPADGRLNLPYIKGEVNAIDKSAASLQKILTDSCGDLTNKNIIVTLQESSKRVYVTGALRAAIPLEHPMTVSQIVAAAGGAPEESLDKPVILTCVENGKTVSYSIRLDDPTPVYVKPNDEIRVPLAPM